MRATKIIAKVLKQFNVLQKDKRDGYPLLTYNTFEDWQMVTLAEALSKISSMSEQEAYDELKAELHDMLDKDDHDAEYATLNVSIPAIGNKSPCVKAYDLSVEMLENESAEELRKILRELCDCMGNDVFKHLFVTNDR